MADLIDRDAVLHDVSTECINAHEAKYYEAQVALTRAKRIICDAPAVNLWIPCSERLPEIKKDHESDCVLCYCDTGAYAFSTLQENFFGQVCFACEKEDDYHNSIGKVIAWMPLPEPPERE